MSVAVNKIKCPEASFPKFMSLIFRTLPFLFIASLVSFCKPAPIDITGFDEAAFRADPLGCRGDRAQMKEVLMQVDSALKGLSQQQIQATLGKPDRHELAPRSQKYFVYYIDPSPECGEGNDAPFTLFVRFSALDRSTEISYQNY